MNELTYSVFCVGVYNESSNSWIPENRFYKGVLKPSEVKGNFIGFADNVVFPISENFRLRNGNKLPKATCHVKTEAVEPIILNPNKHQKKKITIHAREGKKCFYCKEYLPLDLMTKDHVKAKSLGGTNNIKNLVTCCKKCNLDKDNLSVIDFSLWCSMKIKEYLTQGLNKSKGIPRLQQIIISCNELIENDYKIKK